MKRVERMFNFFWRKIYGTPTLLECNDKTPLEDPSNNDDDFVIVEKSHPAKIIKIKKPKTPKTRYSKKPRRRPQKLRKQKFKKFVIQQP